MTYIPTRNAICFMMAESVCQVYFVLWHVKVSFIPDHNNMCWFIVYGRLCHMSASFTTDCELLQSDLKTLKVVSII